jgi:hypothetical protein
MHCTARNYNSPVRCRVTVVPGVAEQLVQSLAGDHPGAELCEGALSRNCDHGLAMLCVHDYRTVPDRSGGLRKELNMHQPAKSKAFAYKSKHS